MTQAAAVVRTRAASDLEGRGERVAAIRTRTRGHTLQLKCSIVANAREGDAMLICLHFRFVLLKWRRFVLDLYFIKRGLIQCRPRDPIP